MRLEQITLGDGMYKAAGFLVISEGALRAIISPTREGTYLIYACDSRVRPVYGSRRFVTATEACRWLKPRLGEEISSSPERWT